MKEMNGVSHFERGERFSLLDGLPPLPEDTKAIFGFKLISTGPNSHWVHADESEFRALLIRIGTPQEKLDERVESQRLTGCSISGNSCVGGSCGFHAACTGMWDSMEHIMSCVCNAVP